MHSGYMCCEHGESVLTPGSAECEQPDCTEHERERFQFKVHRRLFATTVAAARTPFTPRLCS